MFNSSPWAARPHDVRPCRSLGLHFVKATALSCLLALLVLNIPSALAGSWQIGYTMSNAQGDDFASYQGGVYSFADTLCTSGQNSGTAAATATATLYWLPSYVGDAPPANVIVKEQTYLNWEVFSWKWVPVLACTGVLDDGRGNIDDSNETYWDDEWDYDSDAWAAEYNSGGGSHLLSVTVSAAQGTVPGTSYQYTAVARVPDCNVCASVNFDADAANLLDPVGRDFYPNFYDATAYFDYSVSLASPPKSVQITRPENSGANIEPDRQVFDFGSGEWTGSGDSVFDNEVDDLYAFQYGMQLAPTTWDANLIGQFPPQNTLALPWYVSPGTNPDDWWTRKWHWYGEDNTASPAVALGVADGPTILQPDIPSFTPDNCSASPNLRFRPHVNWPYDSSGYIPHDLLDEMQNANAPQPQTRRVTFHLTDQANNPSVHPDYNFDHHASFTMTYHNQYELIATQSTIQVPTAQNPWHKMSFNGQDITTSGNFPNWSPSIYYSVDTNWNVSVNAVYISGGGGQSTGQGLYVNPPPRTVPANWVGVVYERPLLIQIPFTYRWYSATGRKINGYDANGNEIPYSSIVNRSPGGFGTYDIETKIVLYPASQAFLDPLAQDNDPDGSP